MKIRQIDLVYRVTFHVEFSRGTYHTMKRNDIRTNMSETAKYVIRP